MEKPGFPLGVALGRVLVLVFDREQLGLLLEQFLVALAGIGGGERFPGLFQRFILFRRRRAVTAARRHGLFEIGGRRLQRALVDEDRLERRLLDLGVDLAQRVAAGKDLGLALLVGRLDGDGDIVIDAARRPFVGYRAGLDLDRIGAVIALDERVEILRRLGIAVIAPGLGEFMPVDGAVERADDRGGVRAVVDIGRIGRERLLARYGDREKSGRCKKRASHRDPPLQMETASMAIAAAR